MTFLRAWWWHQCARFGCWHPPSPSLVRRDHAPDKRSAWRSPSCGTSAKGTPAEWQPSYRHKKNCFSKGDTPRFQKKVLPATALWFFFGHSATLNKTTKKRHIFCVVFRDFQICPVHGGSQNETMDFFHTRGASQVDFTIRFFANLASHLFQ